MQVDRLSKNMQGAEHGVVIGQAQVHHHRHRGIPSLAKGKLPIQNERYSVKPPS